MKYIKKNKIVIIFGILIILLLVFFLIPQKAKEETFPPVKIEVSSPPDKTLQDKTKILEINGTKYETATKDPTSIYDFMQKLKIEGKIQFKEKNYIGMGEFIEEINGIKNSGELNWIYYVNGQKANIGVSNYKINSGDIVSWKYEKSY